MWRGLVSELWLNYTWVASAHLDRSQALFSKACKDFWQWKEFLVTSVPSHPYLLGKKICPFNHNRLLLLKAGSCVFDSSNWIISSFSNLLNKEKITRSLHLMTGNLISTHVTRIPVCLNTVLYKDYLKWWKSLLDPFRITKSVANRIPVRPFGATCWALCMLAFIFFISKID